MAERSNLEKELAQNMCIDLNNFARLDIENNRPTYATNFVEVTEEIIWEYRLTCGCREMNDIGETVYKDYYTLQSRRKNSVDGIRTVVTSEVDKDLGYILKWSEGSEEPEARLESFAQFYKKFQNKLKEDREKRFNVK